MAAQERRRSRGELIRQRTQAQFVGRRAQLSLFSDNLAKDPLSESDPADFLFCVHGLGGVGKSTLLRQWREAAQRAGALTAVVDENDAHGVPQALTELARQIAREAGVLKGFDRAVEQFEQQAREQAAAGEEPADGAGGASLSSRVVAQATFGALSFVPGAGAVTSMANPDTAALGIDRLRESARGRGRRGMAADASGLSRAFVTELERLCRQHRWVVLFFDTWEQTGRHLDAWVRDLVQDAFGPLPVNVMVVLAGREELSERDWAPLRHLVNDLPLEVFTEDETRALLAARGVSDPARVDAVYQLSLGLPLLVELLALTPPEQTDAGGRAHAAGGSVNGGGLVDGGDAIEAVVKRFVRWISDADQQKTVLACALAPQLNEDVFAAVAPEEGRHLWGWLNEQPFVSGHGDFKQYHEVVRAGMVRQQRLESPQRWTAAHLRLAEAQAGWRAAIESRLPADGLWQDARWRRHRMAEEYHRMCADPVAGLEGALELTVHAAGRTAAMLQEWVDTWEQAARDTDDRDLRAWAARLRTADSELAVLDMLLARGVLPSEVASWARVHRCRQLFYADRDDEVLAALDRELDRVETPTDIRRHALATRGALHAWQGRHDQGIADLTASLDLSPTYWALAWRGEAHRLAGHYEEAVADLTAAIERDPADAWAFTNRGDAHQDAGRHDEAVADLTTAIDLMPGEALLFEARGEAHRDAGRLDDAIADLNTAIELDPGNASFRITRGEMHWLADRYDDAVRDQTAALEIDPANARALAVRGTVLRQAGHLDEAITDLSAALALAPTKERILAELGAVHQAAERWDEAVAHFTAALELSPDYAWALARRGLVHRSAGRLEDAVADLTAALDVRPDYAWALEERGSTHRQAGRYDAAVADFDAAHALVPDDPEVLAGRGFAHRLAGRYEAAVRDLTAALALAPDYGWALALRGNTHRMTGNYDAAVRDRTAVLALDPPDRAEALALRGEAHRLAGRLDSAIADFDASLAIDPDESWVLASRGQAHHLAGRTEEAFRDLDAALAMSPEEGWVVRERGRWLRQAGHHERAREDFERAAGLEGVEEYEAQFELLLLDTLVHGFVACETRWRELLRTPVDDEDWGKVFGLLRALLLEPDRTVEDAAAAFRRTAPDGEIVTYTLVTLSELAATDGPTARRAGRCREIVAEWPAV
ncbi:tetratricopeptide repeat protein [Streptomyces sp. NPDC059524]|uniref:tetratricopeptide repeat protein n=1 Tax=Streptomyces sp. NPDC059524 TaxID=3346856 RepID=UPI0036C4BB98